MASMPLALMKAIAEKSSKQPKKDDKNDKKAAFARRLQRGRS